MEAVEFLPHIYSIKEAYDFSRVKRGGWIWYTHRTDEILSKEDTDTLNLVCMGTEPRVRDWFWNFAAVSTEWLNMGKVHGGFARNVMELAGREDEPNSLINQAFKASEINNKRILIEGHSRGGALSYLLASLLVSHGIDKNKIIVVTVGSAKVGNKKFNVQYKEMLGDKTFILNGSNDPVQSVPFFGGTNGKVTKIKFTPWYRPRHLVKHYLNAVLSIKKSENSHWK